MNRRQFLTATGTASVVGLAGCISQETEEGVFQLTDIGLVRREGSVAAFAEVENTSQTETVFRASLAPFTTDGVRLDDWKDIGTPYAEEEGVRPSRRVRYYVAYDAGDSHWFDENDVGQVVDANTAVLRRTDNEGFVTGPDYTTENIGDVIGTKETDSGWF